MQLDIRIDKLTPCLIEISTGKVLQTTFSLAKSNEIKDLQTKGWNFDWTDRGLARANIYKLQLEDDDEIQGLVAAEVVRGAVYIHIIESAPHNQPHNKKYRGVGGHLFAIAMRLSVAMGFGGYVYFDVKNTELVKHYSDMLGATMAPTRFHEYRMEVLEKVAHNIIDKYTLEGDLDVEQS